MLRPKISCFENSVDPDQLASVKPVDLDQHCFPSALKYMLIDWDHAKQLNKIWEV